MKTENKKLSYIKYVPVAVCLVVVVVCLIFASNVDFEDILYFTPKNLFLASFVLWVCYAIKAMSIVIPATIFFVAAGHIYPYWAAVIVNIIGLAISFTLQYFIGKISGGDAVEMITEKYPKAAKIVDYGHENNFFAVYISRAITVVPNDLVSMLHGALGMPYPSFILGSVIGLLPEMLVETYIGGKLSDLSWRSLLVMIGLMIVTLVISMLLNKRISKKFHKRRKIKEKTE